MLYQAMLSHPDLLNPHLCQASLILHGHQLNRYRRITHHHLRLCPISHLSSPQPSHQRLNLTPRIPTIPLISINRLAGRNSLISITPLQVCRTRLFIIQIITATKVTIVIRIPLHITRISLRKRLHIPLHRRLHLKLTIRPTRRTRRQTLSAR